MSKIGAIVIQAQEDVASGMTLSNFLKEYGHSSLWIWEQANGEAPDEGEFLSEADYLRHLNKKVAEDLESLGEDRPLSAYGKSIAEQTDEEIQTEHWADDRRIRTSDF